MHGLNIVKTAMGYIVSAMLFLVAVPHAASAVSFITPSASITDAQSNATTLSVGGTYLTNGFRFVGSQAHFDDYFAFATTSPLKVTVTASTLEANPVENGPFGLAGLTMEWLALAGSATFTDPNGVLDTTARLVTTLTTGGPYLLHVFGTALADGGEYSVRVTAGAAAGDTPSPVPLPPAILLLGSVLGGFAATRLRRRSQSRL